MHRSPPNAPAGSLRLLLPAPAAAVETTVDAFECDVVDILSANKRVKLGIDKKSVLPILQGVHIKDGRLTTTDLETTVSTYIDAAGKLDIVAPIALLEKVLGKLSGAVVLRREGLDLQVTELAGSRAYTFTSWASDDCPLETIDPCSSPASPGCLDGATPGARSHAIGKDPTRIGLTRVSVDGRTVVTTDSYRMVVHALPAEHVELPKVLIRGRACRIVEKLKGAASVVASKKDTRVDLAFSSLDDGLHHERALKVSMAAAGIGSAAETIGFAGDVHHCRCEDPDCKEDHGATLHTAFRPTYLAEGLEVFSAGRVALQFSSPLRPLVMRDDDDAENNARIGAESDDARRVRVAGDIVAGTPAENEQAAVVARSASPATSLTPI